MREILFRGKRTDNGEWICSGNLIHFNEDNEYYIPVANSKCTCTHDENDNIVEWDEVMFCKVIPETVGQFTGLTDKNGKKIFEGDIVKHPIGTFVVKFLSGTFCCSLIEDDYLTDICSIHNACEVIGNIHDNPELLRPSFKPEYLDGDPDYPICPNCRTPLNEMEDCDCGAKIDWSEE